MATLNLGRIKPVFRGAYSGSTAYVVDDIVTSGGSSYICIQAHGAGTQAVTQTAYWSVLAQTGTDVGTTLTTQGDILYRDGSGLQRLAKGTASQVLKMNSSANAPEWGADEGGKILQVVTTNKIDAWSTSSGSYVDITGLSATLTPSATTSKILVQVSLGSFQSNGDNNRAYCRLKQAISGGATTYPFLPNDATGHESIATTCFRSNAGEWQQMPVSFMKLTGALNTTSAVTFTVQAETDGSTTQLNKSYSTDGNTGNCHSSITLFEIAG